MADRFSAYDYSVAELKTTREATTLYVFALFSIFYFGESPGLSTVVGSFASLSTWPSCS
jgi:uncharacterized protein (DUF486 family)